MWVVNAEQSIIYKKKFHWTLLTEKNKTDGEKDDRGSTLKAPENRSISLLTNDVTKRRRHFLLLNTTAFKAALGKENPISGMSRLFFPPSINKNKFSNFLRYSFNYMMFLFEYNPKIAK